MTLEEFKLSYQGKEPPVCLSKELKSMWYAANDEWKKAHELVQYEKGKDCALIHAFLHRTEGDKENANYWYAKAGNLTPQLSAEEEFEHIIDKLL